MKFKTNIMCGDCIKKVTPVLDELAGADNWEVDTKTPQKLLTIESDHISDKTVVEVLNRVGYRAELLS